MTNPRWIGGSQRGPREGTWSVWRDEQARPKPRFCILCRDLRPAGGCARSGAVEHERLARLMGLWDAARSTQSPHACQHAKLTSSSLIEARAIGETGRPSISTHRSRNLRKTLGLTHATRYINALSLGPLREYEKVTDGQTPERFDRYGLQITSIYDFGEARTREAQETYMQAADRLAEKAVNVRSEVREAFIAYKGAFEVAHLYQAQVEPLQNEILKQSLANQQRANRRIRARSGRPHPHIGPCRGS
jgi:outer membrane protein TolC